MVNIKKNDKNFIAKKRKREKSSSKSLKNLTSNVNYNKNSTNIEKTNKKTTDTQNSPANEMEIQEETKDNSNNNEASNNYAKNSRSNNIFYGNDFKNFDRMNGINYKNLKNRDFSDDENINYKKNNSPNGGFEFYQNNKIEKYLNSKNLSSPQRKRKFASNNLLNFSLEKERKKNYNNIKKEKNGNDTCNNCFLCGWEYPKEMDVKDKNEHVNYCADGEGEKHKKIYASSQRLIKIAINSQDAENTSNRYDIINNNSNNKKERRNNYCYICTKTINLRNGKTIDDHILQCYKEKEEEIFVKMQKK
jgi:hypothetical protein